MLLPICHVHFHYNSHYTKLFLMFVDSSYIYMGEKCSVDKTNSALTIDQSVRSKGQMINVIW